MMAFNDTAKQVLQIGAPYIVCLIVIKLIALAAVFLMPASGAAIVEFLVLAATLATAFDIVIRMAASRRSSFLPSRHGADALLALLLAIQGFGCVGSEVRGCKALHMVLPFVVLVSVGGNVMRMTRSKAETEEGSSLDRMDDSEMGKVVGGEQNVE
mmetsp:Transcript_77999/g.137453  ORF Transcript_77999/g.137453 Transcript_77999/m.137453 type:complete len:156 (-) Transcript_77999:42-509(-)